MNSIVIREAAEEDLPSVLELYLAAGIGDVNFSIEEARAQLEVFRRYPSLRVFVVLMDGVIVGTYELLIMDNLAKRGSKSGLVEDVAVAPQSQGKGVGRAMMQHAFDQCLQADCYKLVLSSNQKREGAHGFYESLGFERHGYSFLIELEPGMETRSAQQEDRTGGEKPS